MAEQSITLKIAGKSYPLHIESGKEELYRLAERELNAYLKQIKQKRFQNWTDSDYVAMTALKFAIANISLRQSRETSGEELLRLERLEQEIDDYMNEL